MSILIFDTTSIFRHARFCRPPFNIERYNHGSPDKGFGAVKERTVVLGNVLVTYYVTIISQGGGCSPRVASFVRARANQFDCASFCSGERSRGGGGGGGAEDDRALSLNTELRRERARKRWLIRNRSTWVK